MIAPKLGRGDGVRVVSPATSLGFIPTDQREIAAGQLAGLGLEVGYAARDGTVDRFDSAPVADRLSDLHDAFSDPGVKGLFTTLGGYNSNQLLGRLDYDLIGENPKVFCGYSDITALHNAIHARTGLVTYYGPHFSTFAMKRGIAYTRDMLARCVMDEGPFAVEPADHWSDDAWFEDQDNRRFHQNPGYRVINEGRAEGRLLGGHLGTFCLLSGTTYMPDLSGALLLLECDDETQPHHLDRELQALLLRPDFAGVRGILFGRFQPGSNVDPATLEEIVRGKPELSGIPVVADASFGHTTPQFTFPVGGGGRLWAEDGSVGFEIEAH